MLMDTTSDINIVKFETETMFIEIKQIEKPCSVTISRNTTTFYPPTKPIQMPPLICGVNCICNRCDLCLKN